jgi:hypothetical protein
MSPVRSDVSEERIASIIMVEKIDYLGTTLAVTIPPFLFILMMTFLRNVGSYKNHTASHPRRRHSHNHSREYLNPYTVLAFWCDACNCYQAHFCAV